MDVQPGRESFFSKLYPFNSDHLNLDQRSYSLTDRLQRGSLALTSTLGSFTALFYKDVRQLWQKAAKGKPMIEPLGAIELKTLAPAEEVHSIAVQTLSSSNSSSVSPSTTAIESSAQPSHSICKPSWRALPAPLSPETAFSAKKLAFWPKMETFCREKKLTALLIATNALALAVEEARLNPQKKYGAAFPLKEEEATIEVEAEMKGEKIELQVSFRLRQLRDAEKNLYDTESYVFRETIRAIQKTPLC